ncbi:MAG: molybdate ABC transporter permease subunit, partial [Bacteroidales bacterium]|nr:molybdate ABC transporter permease subunit [Bacteroidales bacterium]
MNINELHIIFLSLKVALLATLFNLPFVLVFGWLLARKQFFGKIILEGILHIPLVLPPVTIGYLLLMIFGVKGILGNILFELFDIRIAFSFAAALLASMAVSFPLALRSVKTAFEMIDQQLETASMILGNNFWQSFLKVSMPLAFPGIMSGLVLSFARCMGEFGATITFAGNIPGETQTLPLAIYSYLQTPNKDAETMRLVLASALLSLIA